MLTAIFWFWQASEGRMADAMRKRGWLKAALIASVTLNVLAAGVAVGGWIGHERVDPRQAGFDAQLGPLGGAFTREDRAAMRRDAGRAGANLGAMRSNLRADLDALVAAVDADPWNPDAVRDLLSKMRATGERRAVLGEQVMLQRLSAMTPAERKQYAERLRERLSRGPFRGPPPDPGAEPPDDGP